MAKQALAANRQRIWAFGQTYDFHIVTSTIALNADNYSTARNQKSQIVLHCTAGAGSAEDDIGWWNNPASPPSSAHFIVERPHTRQAARPAGGGADQSDAGLVDAVRVLDDEMMAFHGNNVNANSIGIEITNVGWGWYASSAARDEPTLTGRHVPVSTCPAMLNIGSAAAPNWVCNHARPADTNHYIRLAPALQGYTDYQAFADQQYAALILLLRYLCIRHRIPRTFLGANQAEVFRHYETDGSADERRVYKNILMRFRGIFAHRNSATDNRVCPGVLNRNRLYRGIIDEWWMPVQRDGTPRAYYSGPFAEPPFPTGGPSRNSHFRFTSAGRIVGSTYQSAQLDAVIETRSYYDLDQVNTYYADTETRLGGMFPVGVNRVWHGGVHLPVPDSNPCIYAAASGTIVAARLSSNTDTDRHPTFGSQRFVLIRHAVYRQLEADPGGLGQRINYTANPVFVFSLYMHLAAVRNPAAEHDENPPWFNLWRRNNPGVDIGMDGDKGRVFAPNIQVSVGDILGLSGTFRGRRMIHFEIISHRDTELTGAPWTDAGKRFVDIDDNVMCNVPALDRYLRDQTGDGIDVVDVLRAAESLRDVKAMHKSEWALTSEAQIVPLVPHPDRRAVLWPHFRRFSWVAEAVAANPRLARELGAAGMFWHYHPILFMHHINTLVVGENREIRESEDHTINVETDEDYFLTNFVNWSAASGAFVAANVDTRLLHPAGVSSAAQDFRFSRRDISCFQAGAHTPGPTPAQSTKFSLALLEVVERIRRRFDANMDVTLSFACAGHGANNTLCVMNDADTMAKHRAGVAVDFRPSDRTPATCQRLWNSVVTILNPVNTQYAHLCGTPTQANFPSGYRGIRFGTRPANVDAKLRGTPQQALTAAEAAAFRLHMELIPEVTVTARPDTSALPVRLRVTFEEIRVLNDQDPLGSAEWYLHANVNGVLAGKFSNRDVDTGDVIRVNWVKEVTLQPDANLELFLTGRDAEVFSDDSLGKVSLTYNRQSSPPWGIDRRSARSSNGSFLVTYRIESLATEEF